MASWNFFLFGFLLVVVNVNSQNSACQPLNQIPHLDRLTAEAFSALLTAPCRYEKTAKPAETTKIRLKINLHHMESTKQVEFTAYMTAQVSYNDARLNFKDTNRSMNILGGQSLKDTIWTPHLFIRNSKVTNVMGIDQKDVFVTVTPDGDVTYTYRMSTTFYCSVNLMKFPFDSQECSLSWSGWGYSNDDLELTWDDPIPVVISPTILLADFDFNQFTTTENLTNTTSSLRFTFTIHREIGHYMMNYFLPSILLVCTSWVTFWLQADAGPPRATLGCSTVIAFVTLHGNFASDLPKVSYVKASDVWFLGMSCFIFGSLVEFAFVNVIWRRKKQVELEKPNGKHILKGALVPSVAREHLRKVASLDTLYKSDSKESLPPRYMSTEILSSNGSQASAGCNHSTISMSVDETDEAPTWHTMTPQDVAIWIDRKARIVFPVLFMIFNVFYWSFVYIL